MTEEKTVEKDESLSMKLESVSEKVNKVLEGKERLTEKDRASLVGVKEAIDLVKREVVDSGRPLVDDAKIRFWLRLTEDLYLKYYKKDEKKSQ